MTSLPGGWIVIDFHDYRFNFIYFLFTKVFQGQLYTWGHASTMRRRNNGRLLQEKFYKRCVLASIDEKKTIKFTIS